MKLILFFFFGACLGSFLGVVIDRFPEQSILFPASHCNHCHKQLKPWDLVPILSQVANRFACRYCQKKIPAWYAFFEATIGCLVVLTDLGTFSVGQCLIILCGLVLAIYDIKHREYPFLVWLVFACLALPFVSVTPVTGLLLLLALISHFVSIKIGSGDFLYLASLSTVLSAYQLIWLIQLSSLLGIACFLIFKPKRALPFIPFLLLAYLLIVHIKGV